MESVCESDPPSQFYSESRDFRDDEDEDEDDNASSNDDRKCICTTCASTDPRVNLITFLTCYLAFMALGSCLLSSVEWETEVNLKSELIRKQETFLKKFSNVDRASLNGLISEITKMQSKGITWEPLRLPGESSTSFTCYEEYIERKGKSTEEERKKKENSGRSSTGKGMEETQGRVQSRTSNDVTVVTERESMRVSNSSHLVKFSTCNWDFSSSLLFMTSLVTTIGYGHVSPLTQVGKLLTIILSAVGIPFTLTLLSTAGIILLSSLGSKLESLVSALVSKYQTNSWSNNAATTWPTSTRGHHTNTTFLIRLLHLVFITILLTLVCFFIPAYFFHRFEPDWTYFDAVYFSYISLTTIGLGDFIPAFGVSDICLYRLLTVGYLYIGLTFVMLWLALIYRIPQFNMKYLFISSSESENQFTPSGGGNHCSNRTESIRILNKKSNNLNSKCKINDESPSTSRSSLSKSYGTQNTPNSP